MDLSEKFHKKLSEFLSPEEIKTLIASLDDSIPVSIRRNPYKKYATESLQKIPWTDLGHYLPQRPKFIFDPYFHSGAYYVQEAGSMLIEQALKQFVDLNKSLTVLDLCAAPGGKSTHLLSLISEDSILLSNEVINSRIAPLKQNVIKWGVNNCIITNNDPSDFKAFNATFDVIVIDAPCSGEGMFRKHDHAIAEWSEENVELCSSRQTRILDDIWPTLKEDGILIYSTCTYNLEENEKNIHDFLKHHSGESLRVVIPEKSQIKEIQFENIYGFRMMPHLTKSEGFSMIIIQKKEGDLSARRIKNNLNTKNLFDWKKYLSDSDLFAGIEFENLQFAMKKIHLDFLSDCINNLRVRYFGTEIGETKGKDFIPSQALAHSNYLNESAFSICEVDFENAIKFLQKESIQTTNTDKGLQLVKVDKNAIGFIKNLGNRTNNLFPKSWRILSKNLE